MKSFFKTFLAALLALMVVGLICLFFFLGIIGAAVNYNIPQITDQSVLVIDLSKPFVERPVKNIQSVLSAEGIEETPGLYDLIRLLNRAKDDEKIKGVYLVANENANGFATSEEIKMALANFKGSKKFVIAYGDIMSQRAYNVADIADKIYISPSGGLEWRGMGVSYMFLKGGLDKLDIKPQVFYAGKFKSATEPFRFDKMSDPNKLQTSAWVNDIYNGFIASVGHERKLDTAMLKQLANTGLVQTSKDAVTYKLIDGALYDDQVKDEIKKLLQINTAEKINFVGIEKYAQTQKDLGGSGDPIALIYATGDIVDGKGGKQNIGSTTYVELLRKARLDASVKAIVLRVNSGGGSALASENIWRELALAKKAKPVMVSFGDVAASGGYYISTAADSIFALPNTITGSIGVFGLVPDMSSFFKNKLGITFDGVKTGPLANAGGMDHAMTDPEKKLVQNSIDTIYAQFKKRVADGRKKDTAYIETIAQGRVWSGVQGRQVGLVDAFGGIQTAVEAAAAKAGLTAYRVKEYPEAGTLIEQLLGMNKDEDGAIAAKIKDDMGVEYYNVYKQLKSIKEMCNVAQARLPFDFEIK